MPVQYPGKSRHFLRRTITALTYSGLLLPGNGLATAPFEPYPMVQKTLSRMFNFR